MKLGTIVLTMVTAFALAAQPPPGRGPGGPPGRGGPEAPGTPDGVRNRIAHINVEAESSRAILMLARHYLDKSDGVRRGSPFAADRYLAAADALAHAAEHQQHMVQKSGPEPPDGAEISRHLDRVYFRLQQADFFVKQSADANAKTIATFARQYYQQALRASTVAMAGHDARTADECAKTVDELMRALENLAQSTAPPPPTKPEHRPGRL